ncbi:MAG: hypothetical protein WBA74_05180, partial [Cyclobacteriaceae bacterium]
IYSYYLKLKKKYPKVNIVDDLEKKIQIDIEHLFFLNEDINDYVIDILDLSKKYKIYNMKCYVG